MQEPSPLYGVYTSGELAKLVGLDHLGQVWIRATNAQGRERAWVAHTIDAALIEEAITRHDSVLIQRIAPNATPLVCAIVFAKLQPNKPTPQASAPEVLTAQELSLGDGRARLFVRGNTLHIEADALVSRVRGRHRLLAGSLELG